MSDLKDKNIVSRLDQSNWLEIVKRQVASLRFGVVEIIVHDSQVTQIEKTERLRLDKSQAD